MLIEYGEIIYLFYKSKHTHEYSTVGSNVWLCMFGYLVFMTWSSWLPRFRNTPSGNTSNTASRSRSTSSPFLPRSTKSPLNTYGFSADGSPFLTKYKFMNFLFVWDQSHVLPNIGLQLRELYTGWFIMSGQYSRICSIIIKHVIEYLYKWNKSLAVQKGIEGATQHFKIKPTSSGTSFQNYVTLK